MEINELKEFLIKSWMTHDGMWFYHCLKECGIDTTNKINRAAVKSMSKIEIKRIQKIFGINTIEKFKDLRNIMEKSMEIFKAGFMDFSYTFPSTNQIHCEMKRCWAFEGVTRMGVIDQYQCAIYSRIEGWFEALGVEYDVKPQLNGCLMSTDGICSRYYTFQFKL